jgi:hypothetical protein
MKSLVQFDTSDANRERGVKMNVVYIAGMVLATTVVSRIMFLYMESRAAYRRRMRRSG